MQRIPKTWGKLPLEIATLWSFSLLQNSVFLWRGLSLKLSVHQRTVPTTISYECEFFHSIDLKLSLSDWYFLQMFLSFSFRSARRWPKQTRDLITSAGLKMSADRFIFENTTSSDMSLQTIVRPAFEGHLNLRLKFHWNDIWIYGYMDIRYMDGYLKQQNVMAINFCVKSETG